MERAIRLLYIEDNEPDLRAFLLALQRKELPYDVHSVESIEKARAHLAEFPVDLIIANYNLPDGHSTELLSEFAEIPFILLTGTLEEHAVLRTLEQGADDYLPKDADKRYLDALSLAVQKALYHRRLMQEVRQSEERLSAFMRNLPGAAWIKDLAGRYVSINSEAERIFGVSSEMVCGKGDQDLFPPATARVFAENDRRALAEETGLQTTEVLRHFDGVDHYSIVRKFALKGPLGRPAYVAGVAFDITERIQTEQALSRSEARFRSTFENAAVGIAHIDPQGRYLLVNQCLCDILGYSKEELLGRRFSEVIHPDDMDRDALDHRRLIAGHIDSCRMEKRYVRKDGSAIWVLTTRSLQRDESGKPLYSISIVQDIALRKQAETELRQVAQFPEENPSPVLRLTEEKKLLYANRAAIGMLTELGWRTEQPIPALLEPLVNPNSECSCEQEIATPEGRVFSFTVTHIAASHYFNLYGRDVTARKQAQEALQESEVRFRTLANAIPQLTWIARADGWIVWYNRRWYDYTGTSPEEMQGWGWEKVHDPKTLPAVLERWRNSINTGEPFDMVFPLRGVDGLFRPFLTRVVPLKDANGRIVQWFGTNTDISEQRKIEEELAAAKAHAEQASRAKDHFLAVLSHEMRTPLTPVLMGLSLLQDRADLDSKMKETLEMIRRNVEMEARLIDDLLDVTRIARGKTELHRNPVELGAVIARAVEVCKPDIEARGLHLSVDMGSSSPYWVHADESRLQQVFWNLLKNAVKFTPQDGCIGIRCSRDDGRTVIEVVDSGIGIETDSLQRVFNAFEQAGGANNRQFGGLGLGLAISKALIEMHGGAIEAYSEGQNKGATFRVQLPATTLKDQSRREVASDAQMNALRPLHILLVEDHSVTARMIKMVLNEKGHVVETAGDVQTALDLASQHEIDLLLSDIGLPDGSGHDLMQRLRSLGHTFPGIALSGYGQEHDIRKSYEVGFSAHLTKPASRETLLNAVASISSHRAHLIGQPNRENRELPKRKLEF